jgi:hypothetical protein
MKVLNLNVTQIKGYEVLKVAIVFTVIALLWPIAQQLVLNYDDTAGYISPGSIVLLMLISLLCFLMMVAIAAWLLQRFLVALSLPGLGIMVLQFKKLELWQQLGFYWASFFLLLLAAVACLSAVF